MDKEKINKRKKYVYFLCIGLAFGYIIGTCNNRNIIKHKEVSDYSYKLDTVPTINGWVNAYSIAK